MLIQQNQQQARQVLIANPQLTKALFQVLSSWQTKYTFLLVFWLSFIWVDLTNLQFVRDSVHLDMLVVAGCCAT
jgi:hypothetical protein